MTIKYEPERHKNRSTTDCQARIAELKEKLARGGHRLTPQRLYVLEALVDSEAHPTAEAIFERVRRTCPTTSLATVYKTLETLKAMGEVLELEFSEGSNRYDGLRPAAHPHVVCERCGKIEDVEVDGVPALQAQAVRASGFRIRSHRLEFYGVCSECQ